jgi:hypothetical protein
VPNDAEQFSVRIIHPAFLPGTIALNQTLFDRENITILHSGISRGGIVVDEVNEPIAGAIIIKKQPKPEYQITSDSNGGFVQPISTFLKQN